MAVFGQAGRQINGRVRVRVRVRVRCTDPFTYTYSYTHSYTSVYSFTPNIVPDHVSNRPTTTRSFAHVLQLSSEEVRDEQIGEQGDPRRQHWPRPGHPDDDVGDEGSARFARDESSLPAGWRDGRAHGVAPAHAVGQAGTARRGLSPEGRPHLRGRADRIRFVRAERRYDSDDGSARPRAGPAGSADGSGGGSGGRRR